MFIKRKLWYFSPDRDTKAAIAYDMQQEFRYRRAWFLKPEGGYTVDFGRPLPCNEDPCDFPKAECYDVDGEIDNKIEYKLVQRLSSIRGNER